MSHCSLHLSLCSNNTTQGSYSTSVPILCEETAEVWAQLHKALIASPLLRELSERIAFYYSRGSVFRKRREAEMKTEFQAGSGHKPPHSCEVTRLTSHWASSNNLKEQFQAPRKMLSNKGIQQKNALNKCINPTTKISHNG